MNLGDEGSAEATVTFAPRLTEDSLPVTLPKDADKRSETATDEEQVRPSSAVDKPVCAGVLDLQLVPQVCITDVLAIFCPACTRDSVVVGAVTRAANQKPAARAAATAEGC